MKEKILVGVLLAVALGVGIYKIAPAVNPPLNVNEVAADPGAFEGNITLAGVTAGFSKEDKTLFGIMDLKELQCKTPGCNKVILPVRYQGKIPDLGDEVRVTGAFIRDGQGYYFAGERLELVRNHKLGG